MPRRVQRPPNEPSLVPCTTRPAARRSAIPRSAANLGAVVASDVAQIRANQTSIIETGRVQTTLLERQVALFEQHMRHFAACNEYLLQQIRQQQEILRVVMSVPPMIDRQTEELIDHLPKSSPKQRVTDEGAASSPDRTAVAPNAMQTVVPATVHSAYARRRSTVNVHSVSDRYGGYLSEVTVECSLLAQLGFEPQDCAEIMREGICIVLRRCRVGGIPGRRNGNGTVSFRTTVVGNVNLLRYHVTTAPGEMRF